MSPCELEWAVAEATGETRREIRRRGFQLLSETEATDDVDAAVVDWDSAPDVSESIR